MPFRQKLLVATFSKDADDPSGCGSSRAILGWKGPIQVNPTKSGFIVIDFVRFGSLGSGLLASFPAAAGISQSRRLMMDPRDRTKIVIPFHGRVPAVNRSEVEQNSESGPESSISQRRTAED